MTPPQKRGPGRLPFPPGEARLYTAKVPLNEDERAAATRLVVRGKYASIAAMFRDLLARAERRAK